MKLTPQLKEIYKVWIQYQYTFLFVLIFAIVLHGKIQNVDLISIFLFFIEQKSMTPVKQIDVKQKFNASNSLLKSTPIFKQPKPFANIQNKLKQMSEPRPKRIVSTKRILNRMSAIHSTTKKASFIHSNRSPRSSSAKKYVFFCIFLSIFFFVLFVYFICFVRMC